MLITGIASWFFGDTSAVIFQKILVAPIFLLASKGLRTYFPGHLDDTRGLATQAEFEVLNAALLAAFITIVVTTGEASLERVLLDFVGVTVVISAANILIFWYRQKTRRQVD
ncbi:hypothetical protein RMR16_013925 [Agrobacterium sp. rho-13.3]|uniref:hypothetical protein n=1 Tax=Agrobacterium sp. rho-13.3 TaxID=3072980 RepID=UPI002A168A58|nr:hypothetical protein [Agrobacterium sp. rho-13.3]MDX8309837.1 hypothetical protein [Agrobacterium sp. rho-13.3]